MLRKKPSPLFPSQHGFTLLELSIVLVIIGLIIGGIVAGGTLIDAATTRAQVTQIDRYQTAVHAFENKYGFLPGDIPDPYATQFGFQARGTIAGEGDGNNVLEGNCAGNLNSGFDEGMGELAVFWQDLNVAQLIDGGGAQAGATWPKTTACTSISGDSLVATWLPRAKLGQGNYVYLFSYSGANYYGISRADGISWTLGTASRTPGVTVMQAYNIDKKADDGLPQAGNIMACYVNSNLEDHRAIWAAGGGLEGNPVTTYGNNCVPTTAATPYLSTNCYDNSNVSGSTQKYSLTNANLQNCALSFQFQ